MQDYLGGCCSGLDFFSADSSFSPKALFLCDAGVDSDTCGLGIPDSRCGDTFETTAGNGACPVDEPAGAGLGGTGALIDGGVVAQSAVRRCLIWALLGSSSSARV